MTREAMIWWCGLTLDKISGLHNAVQAEVDAHGLDREDAMQIVYEQEGKPNE